MMQAAGRKLSSTLVSGALHLTTLTPTLTLILPPSPRPQVMQKLQVTGKAVVVIINKSDLLKDPSLPTDTAGSSGSAGTGARLGFTGGIMRNGTVGHAAGEAVAEGVWGGKEGMSGATTEAGAVAGAEDKPRRRLLLRRNVAPAPAPAPAGPASGPSAQAQAQSQASLSREYAALHAELQRTSPAQGGQGGRGGSASAGSDSSSDSSSSSGGGSGGGGGGGNVVREQQSVMALPALLARWAERLPRAYIVCVSAQEGWGLAPLRDLLVSLAPLGPKYFPSDTVTNRDERFFASEIVREALLACYQDEVRVG